MTASRKFRIFKIGVLALTMAVLAALAHAADSPSAAAGSANAEGGRERLLMDSGWKFHLGELGFEENIINAGVNGGPAGPKFNDSKWRTLNLPHDWGVELPFDADADGSHGYKAFGPGMQNNNNIGWYRREFTLPKTNKGKRLWLEFDGVYRDCRVFLNGYRLIHHEGGYNSFRCDITDVADYSGKNVLAVRVDASEDEGWFYEGAGIYRHVWLVKTAPVAIVPDGIFVYATFSNALPVGDATVHLRTQLHNWETTAADATVHWEILDPSGNKVATADSVAKLPADGQKTAEQTTGVPAPILWSPETPNLYKVITTLENGGQVVDREETAFGIRTLAFDADNGFLLNGKHYAIHGTCNHQDHAGVGSALPDALQYFRVNKLKEMGCNALRTSHNEPTAELLDACDQLGLLVLDETRNFASNPQALANLEQQIRRDRNHPSVFIWSLGNEEPLQRTEADGMIADTMRKLAHRLDPTRSCTFAMSSWSSGEADGISHGVDVQGFNYFRNSDMDAFHKANPRQPGIGTEEGSDFYTRGIYAKTATYEPAYDEDYNGNGATAEKCLKLYVDRPWVSGSFIWTGFDYRGEPTPFGWPNINSEFGILDTCGFPKDIFYFYKSWWTTNVVLHLLPHWNWPDKIGRGIDVWCFSNCKEVELFLNGRSLGKKEMPRYSHLQWNVKYEPGALSARGYDAGGNIIAQTQVETAGAPAAFRLVPDRATVHPDGRDCSVVTVAVTDSQGRTVPTADNLVHFEISGPGKIIGVGNGDPICHEPDVYVEKPDVRAIALGDWRMTNVANLKDLREVAENFDDSNWQKVNVRTDEGPLREDEIAVFRTRVPLTAEDLAVDRADLNFGMIDDDGWVYVNGQFAGESHNWSDAPSFDIRKFLHTGDNTVAVTVKNSEGSGGINKGASLEFVKPPIPANWQRSAFNGLAEVIVQADKNVGAIKLTARADGLQPATLVIQTQAASTSAAP